MFRAYIILLSDSTVLLIYLFIHWFGAGQATWGGEKTRQAEQDEYDGSEFMAGGAGPGMQGAQCKQM